jgi:hypothetical protein
MTLYRVRQFFQIDFPTRDKLAERIVIDQADIEAL